LYVPEFNCRIIRARCEQIRVLWIPFHAVDILCMSLSVSNQIKCISICKSSAFRKIEKLLGEILITLCLNCLVIICIYYANIESAKLGKSFSLVFCPWFLPCFPWCNIGHEQILHTTSYHNASPSKQIFYEIIGFHFHDGNRVLYPSSKM